MITITDIDVKTYTFASFNVTWEVTVPTGESADDYEVFIWRGETPAFDADSYTKLASGIASNAYDYEDTTVSGLQYHQWRKHYYTVQPYLISAYTTSGAIPTPDAIDTDMDFQAREIIKRESYTLAPRYGGIETKVLKRKTYGTHCTTCWDSTLGRQTIDQCTECWDTGWSGGYYPEIEINAMLTPTINRTGLNIWGEWQPGDRIMTLGPYPHLSPRDVIVDQLNRRWVVKDVIPTQKGLYTINQNAHLRLINKDDIIYKYTVTW